MEIDNGALDLEACLRSNGFLQLTSALIKMFGEHRVVKPH